MLARLDFIDRVCVPPPQPSSQTIYFLEKTISNLKSKVKYKKRKLKLPLYTLHISLFYTFFDFRKPLHHKNTKNTKEILRNVTE